MRIEMHYCPADTMDQAAPLPDPRPVLAYVVHTLAPWRIHIQTRIAREVPEFRLNTLVSWNQERHLWRFDDLRERSPEIGIVTFPGGVHEETHGTLGYVMKDWRAGANLIAWCRTNKPACVVMCGYVFPSHYRLIRWLRRNRVPYMLWSDSNIHGDGVTGWRRAMKNTLVPPVMKHAAAVLPCGTNGVRFYSRYGASPEKTFLCPIEPDYQVFENPEPALVSQTRERFKLDPSRRRLVVCARLVELKSIDVTIEAFSLIAQARPDLDLVIIGDGPLRAQLEGKVPPRLRETDRVIFTGFQPDPKVVSAIFSQCDCLVHPGWWEAWGMVIVEAAAAGLAIVASRVVGAAADLVKDDVNGRLVPPRDVGALRTALHYVTDPGMMTGMKAASKVVSQEWRMRADPIKGLRAALSHAGLL